MLKINIILKTGITTTLRYKPSVIIRKCKSQNGKTEQEDKQEDKARQIFRKTNIFYPLIRTRTYLCVSGGKKCLFFGKFDVLCFFETRFEIRPLALSPTKRSFMLIFVLFKTPQEGYCLPIR